MSVLRVGIGQLNSRVGDFDGNVKKIVKTMGDARKSGVDFLVFPEMSVCGYPAEDLAFRGAFLKSCRNAMEAVAKAAAGDRMVVVAGGIEVSDSLYNSAAVIHRGAIRAWARKRRLFCCGRVDESRYFSAGERALMLNLENIRVAVTLGDDLGYPVFPNEVGLLVNLWNEPYRYGKRPVKGRLMTERAREDTVAIVMANPAGGQDDFIFEGSSKIIDSSGEVLARGKPFAEDLVIADLDLLMIKALKQRAFRSPEASSSHLEKAEVVNIEQSFSELKKPAKIKSRIERLPGGPEELFLALALSVKDFILKNGMELAIIGMSGGIDSALAACVAAQALGPKKVLSVSMPGPHTSRETRRDAEIMAKNLGARFMEIPIKPVYASLVKALGPAFLGTRPGLAEENMQARSRGIVLMALANKFRGSVLATGNKSEAGTGYCTLYGDTSGAFAPLIDVYKTGVYELAAWYNKRAGSNVIPLSIINRPPTAELRPNQKDQDTLPPYEELDRILAGFLEKGLSVEEMLGRGEDQATVHQVMGMLMRSEFKRRQSPLGPTVSERPLSDLRLPIAKTVGWWKQAPADGKKSSPGRRAEKIGSKKAKKK